MKTVPGGFPFLGYVPTENGYHTIAQGRQAGSVGICTHSDVCYLSVMRTRNECVFSKILSGLCETVEKCYENRFRSYFIIDKNERLCYISVCLVVKEKPWILIMRIF